MYPAIAYQLKQHLILQPHLSSFICSFAGILADLSPYIACILKDKANNQKSYLQRIYGMYFVKYKEFLSCLGLSYLIEDSVLETFSLNKKLREMLQDIPARMDY